MTEASFFMDLVKNLGPLVAMVAFYMWRDGKREERMGAALAVQEAYIKGELTALIKECVRAITIQSETGQALVTSNQELVERLSSKPCLLADGTRLAIDRQQAIRQSQH